MVVRGRLAHAGKRAEPVKLTRRTNASGNFRGSSGGMVWRTGIVVLETRNGATVRLQPGRIRKRKRRGPLRESEGFVVLTMGMRTQRARREGTLLCSSN